MTSVYGKSPTQLIREADAALKQTCGACKKEVDGAHFLGDFPKCRIEEIRMSEEEWHRRKGKEDLERVLKGIKERT